jgi:hypothetical protein
VAIALLALLNRGSVPKLPDLDHSDSSVVRDYHR